MSTNSSIKIDELNHFAGLSSQWWDESGPLHSLHALNPTRLEFICQHLSNHFTRKFGNGQMLKGLSVLDVGCGGGILCEPLARLGATVTGIDPVTENCKVAQHHAEASNLAINYLTTTVEQIHEKFDVVLAMEVVEHVDNVNEFIQACCTRVKPKGIIFFSTLNRTTKSYLLGIVAAEYILRWAPKGTHHWDQFVRPEELGQALKDANFRVQDQKGMRYNLGHKTWELCTDLSVNYVLCAQTIPVIIQDLGSSKPRSRSSRT